MCIDNQHDPKQPPADIDDLLLELDHQLINLRHAIEHRFERESLSDVRHALLAAQTVLNKTCAELA